MDKPACLISNRPRPLREKRARCRPVFHWFWSRAVRHRSSAFARIEGLSSVPTTVAMPSCFLRRKPLRCVFPSSANDEIESCALVSERCTRFGTRRHRLLDTAACSGRGGATVSPPTPSVPSPCPRSDGVMDGEERWRRTRPRSRGSESRTETEWLPGRCQAPASPSKSETHRGGFRHLPGSAPHAFRHTKPSLGPAR